MGKKVQLEFNYLTTIVKDIELPEGKSIDDMIVSSSTTHCGMTRKKTNHILLIPKDEKGSMCDVPDWIEIDRNDFDELYHTDIGCAFRDDENNGIRVEEDWYSVNYLEEQERVYKRWNIEKGSYETLENPNNSQFDWLVNFGDESIIDTEKIRKVITNYKCKSN